MTQPLILLSIPNLREKDVEAMPRLCELTAGGEIADLRPSFPAVTCSVQANMTTGWLPRDHGIVANGLYWRERRQVEMWTAPNDCIERLQVWDLLSHATGGLKSAVWFPLHSQGCEADYVCTPAPIHNPDGSESLWCYTRPIDLYGTLRDALGHFPLKHYWGPLAGLPSSQWIADSALFAARQWRPDFFYIYLPQLDYAAQKTGPESAAANQAVRDLDAVIGSLGAGMQDAYGERPLWVAAGEYAITPVCNVVYPNRILREAGLLTVREEDGKESIDFETSRAWAMVDHQLAHVFVSGGDERLTQRVAELLRGASGVDEVLIGPERTRYAIDHPRSGEAVLICRPDAWAAYYWWFDDARAPAFARQVDIHRKPGYDPVELFLDPATKGIPLDANLVKGSHGAPVRERSQQTVVLVSEPLKLPSGPMADTHVFGVVLQHFGLQGT
jgi:predicted AlkP superfamily pyrophosphatase or phosphodiesterase